MGESEEGEDVQAQRKGPVAALLKRDAKATGVVDPWALLLPTQMLTGIHAAATDRVVDICKMKIAVTAGEESLSACLNSGGQISDPIKEGDCLGSETERVQGSVFGPIKNALSIFAEVLCKGKELGFASPAKKPGTVDLAELKSSFALRSGDRVSFSDVYMKSETQTKGMYHLVAKGNLVERGTRFSYDLVHIPQDKWNKESGGRLIISEQRGERQVVVSAIYSIEEGVVGVRATRFEVKPLSPDRIVSLLNQTTGLLDIGELAKHGRTLSLLKWPKKIDIERDFNRRTTKVASQQLTAWDGQSSTVLIAAVHDENGRADGCSIASLGGKWNLMGRIIPEGLVCAQDGKVERFVQKECFSKTLSSEIWSNRERKAAFAATADCGFGTPAFALDLLNEEGNTQDIQTFDPAPPSLPGIAVPTL